MQTLRYLDLFSGVGGFRLAIERASRAAKLSSQCVGFSEIDSHALKTYSSNFDVSGEADLGDITQLSLDDVKALPDFNILFAGFPCQPFSLMGFKKGFDDTRGTLFFQIANILSVKQPDFFILENVRGLKTHDGGKTFSRIMSVLEQDLGYHVRVELFNSIDFGVPQHRRRLYFIGVKDAKAFDKINQAQFPALNKSRDYPTVWHLLERVVDDKYYLSERILGTILAHGSGNYYSKSEINRLQARPLTASMHKMHRANQDNYYSDAFINGSFEAGRVKPAARGAGRIRRLTPTEAFRLQGFSDLFVDNARKAGVSDTQLYRQAGNAITINVAEDVLSEMFRLAFEPYAAGTPYLAFKSARPIPKLA